MENPTIGQERIIELVLELVKDNVTKCCPPVVIGIGIGSTASEVVKLARTAAFRELDIRNRDKRYRRLEDDVLEKVNNTGIGPQGLGGDTTAIGCNIEFAPCHIATLPLAVFFQCHSLRRASSVLIP
jgi:fumarate hydratase subunit alpha